MSPTDRYDTSQLVENQHEPGSHGRVLKNLLGIKRKREMNRAEESRFVRLMDEAVERFESDHRFTAEDIRWLHRFWLADIYVWAGAYRSVNVGKSGFMFAAAAHVANLMQEFEKDQLNRYTPCNFRDREELVRALAEVHVELVLIHPFREGNGRIARLLSVLMGLQAGLPPLEFSNLRGKKRERYFEAVRAGMDRDYLPMMAIFSEVIERTVAVAEQPPVRFL
ncbi:MAG: Fic family protein [Deltaproteobacteria bacterium]|nr:Fic family protein [Deltaproteobacteria bacterium]